MSVISNTTVLANFAAADALASLKDLVGEVFLSTDVYQEIADWRRGIRSIPASWTIFILSAPRPHLIPAVHVAGG